MTKSITKEGILKEPDELQTCPPLKDVELFFDNGDEYRGLFIETADNDIIIQAASSKERIALPYDRLEMYIERTK